MEIRKLGRSRKKNIYSETNSTFFSQSLDKLRTKESEFVHQQLNLPFTLIGMLVKKSNSFVLNLSCHWLIKTLRGPS